MSEKADESEDTQPAEAPEPPAPREPIFNLPAAAVLFIGACAIIHLARAYLLTDQQDFGVLLRFAFIPIRYSGAYDLDIYAFISPLSYSLLHGGIAHLAINMIWLAAFGSPLANRIGTWRFMLFWAVTSLAAVGLHFVLHHSDTAPLVGASGAISGMMGAAARFAFRIDRTSGRAAFAGDPLPFLRVFQSRATVTFLVVWTVINLATGLGFGTSGMGAQIAWEAHIGGFLAGFLLIRLFDRRPPVAEMPQEAPPEAEPAPPGLRPPEILKSPWFRRTMLKSRARRNCGRAWSAATRRAP